MPFQEKYERLTAYLKPIQKSAIAFSGGKDSFFLLKTAVEVMGPRRVLVLFVNHPFTSKNDIRRMGYFKKLLAFRLKTIPVGFGSNPDILSNPRDRCYHCKKILFQAVLAEARKNGIRIVMDGTTFSDLSEYRPGLAALEELEVKSPLKELGITSHEVERYLAGTGVEPFFLSSSTCLATRFPYGHNLSGGELKRVDEIESFFIRNGIFPVRVRVIPDGIRIETPVHHFDRIKEIRKKLVDFCHRRGIKWITLDLGGIKTGSWD